MRFQPTRQSTRRVSCPVINNNQLTVPCVGSVKQGDSVMIITRNGEPVAVAPIGWGDAVEADISDAATKATSYITDIDSGGVTVHPSDDSTTGVQITEDVDIMRSGTSVINIGTDDAVRVGVETGKNVTINSDSIDMLSNGNAIATFTNTSFQVNMVGTTSQSVFSYNNGEFNVGSMAGTKLEMTQRGGFSFISGGSLQASIDGDGLSASSLNGLKAYAAGTSSAANYFALINADTGVGVQFIFNPSTRNLAVRYTTNGGTNWSSAKTIASWS